MIKVFNADDHPILCKGVSDLIGETQDMEWVGSAADGNEALRKIRALQPDVAILDIEMPGLTGLEVAKKLLDENTSTQLILLTLFKEEAFLRQAIDMGVKGYLLKESRQQEILDCIRTVANKQAYISPGMSRYLIKSPKPENSILSALSKHEINILKLISRQKTSAEIADMLFISPKTVGNHRSNIGKKLELSGEQNGLLKWAMKHRDLLK